jgi:hypothetical protein
VSLVSLLAKNVVTILEKASILFRKEYKISAVRQVVPPGNTSGMLLYNNKTDFTIAVLGWLEG